MTNLSFMQIEILLISPSLVEKLTLQLTEKKIVKRINWNVLIKRFDEQGRR